MTAKEKAILEALNKPGFLLVFGPDNVKGTGFNIFQVSGMFSIFERKGLIRRARCCRDFWVLTEAGRGKKRQ